MIKESIVTLYMRDLMKLKAEIEQYPTEESLWIPLPGTINSGGNICQHLIGNLRTYIALGLGAIPYVRDRDAEFKKRYFTKQQLLDEVDLLLQYIPNTIENLEDMQFSAEFPRDVLDMFPEQNIGLILQHLLTHLSYHTGQLNYHRRWVSTSNS